jgi:YbbR domain-containing protein
LFLKLVSLACALGLFLYVRKAESTQRGEILVPMTFLVEPDMRVVEPSGPRSVQVTLQGPMELLRGVQPANLVAQVDLRSNHVLAAQTVPVQVEIPRDLRERNVTAEWTPKTVKVRLDEIITRYLQVTPRIDAEPASGQAFGVPSVHPATVTITGLRSVMDRIRQVRAVVTEIDGKGVVDVLARVSTIDASGTELRDRLQILPATVKVQIPLERKTWTKPGVYVDPRLSPLPPNLVLRSLSIRPPKVEVTGSDPALVDLWVIKTEMILVPAAEGQYERVVRLVPPDGARRVDPPRVRVMLDLGRVEAHSAPSGAVPTSRGTLPSRGTTPVPRSSPEGGDSEAGTRSTEP